MSKIYLDVFLQPKNGSYAYIDIYILYVSGDEGQG